MPETSPGYEPEEEEFVIYTMTTVIGSRGGPDGKLVIATEDGRELRITGIRHLDLGTHAERTEITVAEGEA